MQSVQHDLSCLQSLGNLGNSAGGVALREDEATNQNAEPAMASDESSVCQTINMGGLRARSSSSALFLPLVRYIVKKKASAPMSLNEQKHAG